MSDYVRDSVKQSLANYAEKHDIFHLFETMLEKLAIDRPDDHISYMIKQLSLPPSKPPP